MGGIRHKFTIFAQVICNLIEKRIDLSRQLIQFVTNPAQFQPLIEMAGPHPFGGSNQPLQRFDGPFRQQKAAERCQQEDGQADRGEDSREPVDVLFDELHQSSDADFVVGDQGVLELTLDRAVLFRCPEGVAVVGSQKRV